MDGTGAPGRLLDVRLANGRIAEIGPSLATTAGEQSIDARGLVVVPGFIDLHNHLDQRILADPSARSQIAQGITTALVGQDGESPWPVGEFLDRVDAVRPALNVATLVGHGTVRRQALGARFQRAASPTEIASMSRLVDQGLREGAFGLSSGLEYDPGYEARPEEIVALLARVSAAGGLYATHLRDERDGVLAALDEAVALARRARVRLHVSHLKLGSRGVWGRAADALRLLGPGASADVYPYTYWVGPAASILRPGLRLAGGEALEDAGGPFRVRVVSDRTAPSRAGRTLADIAAAERRAPADVLAELAARHATIACECMEEADLRRILRDPAVLVATDGGIGVAHPRGAGTFPRVLGLYVREGSLLTLETAVHKMTGGPAERLGLSDRGRIAVGHHADLVVIDARRVRDRATVLRPQARPEGIIHVLVGGRVALRAGRLTGQREGKALRRDDDVAERLHTVQ